MWDNVRNTFMRGLGVIVPVVITVFVLVTVFSTLDRLISPTFVKLGLNIPGLGFVTLLLLVFVVGMLSRNLVGNFVVKVIDGVIGRIPLARTIYSAVKDVVKAFSLGQQGKSFRQVVVVEYPRVGIFSLGFVTNDLTWKKGKSGSVALVSVYFPHPPNPTSGVMVLVPRKDVVVLKMSVEEGLKLALSGGIVAPPEIMTMTQK